MVETDGVRPYPEDMPVTFHERAHDPDDPSGPFRRLATPPGAGPAAALVDADAPWVAPDYSTIPDDGHLPSDPDELYLVWPGPAMVMPGNLLPDGSAPTRDVVENATRIRGVRPSTFDDADFLIGEYWRQQGRMRDHLGIPRARREWRDGRAQVVDTPDALQRITELHHAEQRRRAAGC